MYFVLLIFSWYGALVVIRVCWYLLVHWNTLDLVFVGQYFVWLITFFSETPSQIILAADFRWKIIYHERNLKKKNLLPNYELLARMVYPDLPFGRKWHRFSTHVISSWADCLSSEYCFTWDLNIANSIRWNPAFEYYFKHDFFYWGPGMFCFWRS